jgi:hypothetical protein
MGAFPRGAQFVYTYRMKHTTTAGTERHDTVRRAFPGVYWVAGIGWCGPDWAAAAARDQELRDEADQADAAVCPSCDGAGEVALDNESDDSMPCLTCGGGRR